MSFFSSEDKAKTTGSFAMTEEFKPIPEKTVVLAAITEAKWKEDFGSDVQKIALTWTVIEGPHKKRKIIQSLRVNDADPAKSAKAKCMLLAIDHNSGGKLSALDREPTTVDLIEALLNKSMEIKLGLFKSNDGKQINWVMQVAEPGTLEKTPIKEDTSDDIPF